MLKKPAQCQLIWLLLGFLSTAWSPVLGCNTTITLDPGPGFISFHTNQSTYCFWKIKLGNRASKYLWFTLRLDFTLEDCEQCKCEYVEIWDTDWTKDPKNSVGRFCGDLKHKTICIKRGNHVYMEYSSSKNISALNRFLNYAWLAYDPPWTTSAPDHDDHDDDDRHHRHDGDHKGSAITATAVGILLSLVFLVGALACGVCLVQFAKPKRRSRQRQAVAVLHTSDTPQQPKLPHLPNYFENDVALPPPYLETIGTDGVPVETPAYYDNPPPYSILDTESTLETTGDTRASDLINRRQ